MSMTGQYQLSNGVHGMMAGDYVYPVANPISGDISLVAGPDKEIENATAMAVNVIEFKIYASAA